MNPSPASKFKLYPSVIARFRRTSDQMIENMHKHVSFDYSGKKKKNHTQNDKFKETELIIYDQAKRILQAAIGKLEIIISFGVCEFEYMDDVHRAILDYNECTDKYEDIVYEISKLRKQEQDGKEN
ncbi:hypothetical protein B9Z55_025084 [Caenorhabditis nigoni]|uniref:Uncharacterized protein n=1 Tax=Caenorhabditis nigoni TaxID=1611254 RepID=A0A2G5SXD1_9PELO|nr:hypothetical protein B9Z55_025084 [Caenorhabditis nigoni]